jgi:hypothetical protein
MARIEDLPRFEDVRRNARRLLGDARDELRSDCHPNSRPNAEQLAAVRLALHHIGEAKAALDQAARAAHQ